MLQYMLDNAQKQIIATLAYYDEMDYPMTAFEIWKHLIAADYPITTGLRQGDGESSKNIRTYENLSLSEIIESLESEEIGKHVEEFEGFYFLKGRKELVEKRLGRNKLASFKIKKLRKIVWFLRFIPFVRMIAVTGRLAMKNSEKESDWDLFVVLKKGKIWTGRTLVTFFLHLVGKRRHGEKIKDRVCLNYFVTDESLEIDLENRSWEVNLFSASEYLFMIPLFGFKKFRKFQIRNSWIRDFKPNFSLNETKDLGMVSDSHFSKITRKIGEKILDFDFIEKILRKLEREKIAKNPKTHLSGSVIEADDNSLVFLPEPQGKEIWEKTLEKLKKIYGQ